MDSNLAPIPPLQLLDTAFPPALSPPFVPGRGISVYPNALTSPVNPKGATDPGQWAEGTIHTQDASLPETRRPPIGVEAPSGVFL